MVDMTLLLRGLRRYEHTLEHHLVQVSDAFLELNRNLDRLTGRFEGKAARDFEQHMGRTRRGFDHYLEGTKAIRKLLADRVEQLEIADRAGGL